MKLAWGVMAVVCSAPLMAQSGTPIETAFVGREVMVKIDMPATQQGIDLNFDRTQPMDWNQYQQRIKQFGIAIHKGDVVRVTKVIEKKDRIEFQLAGGGFGTFGDDSSTIVSPEYIAPSRYEKDLERQIGDEKDPRRKRDLQRDLDRERERRQRAQAQSANAAKIASQMKAEQVAGKRLQGGSRFNLRWKDIIPSDLRNPPGVEQSLAEYVDFNSQQPMNGSVPPPPPPATGYGTQVQRGMKVPEVDALYGRGRLVSESLSQEGLKTQVIRYQTQDATVDVTFVEGVVVRYALQSR
jgi:hypothetical protein